MRLTNQEILHAVRVAHLKQESTKPLTVNLDDEFSIGNEKFKVKDSTIISRHEAQLVLSEEDVHNYLTKYL